MSVNTVRGPVPAEQLGVVAVHEALLSVVPGAQYAYDITIDRAEVVATLREQLEAFKAAGGGTVVDATGMYRGRDVALLEALSRATGVHIVASTGQGPEDELGGYFLTPQTNPPTPWPAERFAELYASEVHEGMVVPRVERRGAAGLVSVGVTPGGMTPTDESQLRGAARAAAETGVALAVRGADDPASVVEFAVAEGLAAERLAIVGGGAEAVERGAYAIVPDAEAAARLIAAGHGERVLLSQRSVGVAFGEPGTDVHLADLLALAGRLSEADRRRVLVENPAALLTLKGN